MASKPKPLPSFCVTDDSVVSVVSPPMKTPIMKTRTAHSASVTVPGRMRDNIHTARPMNMKPKALLTATIHAPAFGNSLPWAAPTASSGAPIPMLIANSAVPPRNMSPLCAITVSAAIRAGATQAVTTSADNAPMTNAPMAVPLFWLPLTVASLLWIELGICRSKAPNMPNARRTKSPEKSMRTHGWLNVACNCSPAAAAATPSATRRA